MTKNSCRAAVRSQVGPGEGPEVAGRTEPQGAGERLLAAHPPVDARSPALDYCEALLEDAVASLGGHGGAVYSIEKGRPPRLVVPFGDVAGERLGGLELAALASVDGQPRTTSRYGGNVVSPVAMDGHFAVSARLDDHVRVALVVAGCDPEWSPEAGCEELAPVLDHLVLLLERARMQSALELRGQEIRTLRVQLEMYATDLRSAYDAERERSLELVAALADLEETYRATVLGLAAAVDAKDEVTGEHLQRVTRYGLMLTGLVAPQHVGDPQFEYGFLLHDIGKLAVPEEILKKAGPLTPSEWDQVREHPGSGYGLLEGIPFLAGAREIVYAHHERWDGTGYPRGLAREEIPVGAQVFPICDAFDAMTSDRPYRRALSIEAARREVVAAAGSQFWPAAVDAFMSIPVPSLETVRSATHGSS